MAQGPARHVAVIGGGIIGTAAARVLIGDGHRVTLIEPDPPGGPQTASYGNGALISPASLVPVALPGLWAQVPGYLVNRRGPLTIRWAHAPRLLPWLTRYLGAGATEARVARTAAALAALLGDAPRRHQRLVQSIDTPDLIRASGILYLYPGAAEYRADSLAWRLRRQHGVQASEIEGEALQALAPGLAPRYRLGVMLEDGHQCADPGGYAATLAYWCRDNGMARHSARATGFAQTDGHVTAVETDAGPVPCDAAVIAAGMGAAPLAAACGDRVPLEAERGYHVELTGPVPDLPVPVMPQDLKVAIARTRTGLRAAGQVEFAAPDAAPDWRRADLLRDALHTCFPGLAGQSQTGLTRWQGNRPSTPDGLPVIGPASDCAGVIYAFGHGHIGLNAAPMTADLVADLVAGRKPAIDPAPFSAQRFA